MLVRMFRGKVHSGMEERYARYLRDVAVPHILSHRGVREVSVYDPLRAGDEFVVKSVWDDLASMVAFAGEDWQEPQILPTEHEMVAAVSVSHYRPESAFHGKSVTSSSGRLSVDPVAGIASIDGDFYELPPLEARLLAELAERAGRFVEPAELARVIWPGSTAMSPNDVRRAIYRLRRMIRDDDRPEPLVRNRRGYGYMVTD